MLTHVVMIATLELQQQRKGQTKRNKDTKQENEHRCFWKIAAKHKKE